MFNILNSKLKKDNQKLYYFNYENHVDNIILFNLQQKIIILFKNI